MINLSTVAELVQIITGGTQSLQVHASFVDLPASGQPVASDTNTIITTATTTTVVASPAASTTRNVKTLSICNTDAANSDTVTVNHVGAVNTVRLVKLTLLAGYTLTWTDEAGWILTDASGGRVETPLAGRWLKTTVVTNPTTTFTTTASTNTVRLRGKGGGAGGGGCTSVASAAAAAGGGGEGGYLEKTVAVTPNTTYTVACGLGGAGNSGAAGGNGANSTFVIGATTYTAGGGSGALAATASATVTTNQGGAGGTSTNGDLNVAGQPGAPGITVLISPATTSAGNGGGTMLASGGIAPATQGAGNTGSGLGAGGSGSATGASTARAGGAGTNGGWIVDEYS
jgi:hypothetical protein